MKRSLSILISSIVSIMFSSCSTYYFTYDTCLEGSKSNCLQFQDSILTFTFNPVPNGIYFRIDNRLPKSAYIIWDKSYFILPNGNSAKALNIDLLSTTSEVLIKENSESIIPPNSSFSRFTTPNININKTTAEDFIKINQYFASPNYSYLYSTYTTSFSYGNYWPIKLPEDVSLETYLPEIRDFVTNNDKLGIGFSVKIDSDIYEYRFNFRFDNIDVYENPNFSGHKIHRIMSAPKSNNWKWTDTD